MKRVIEGKTYNTFTAAVVARWEYKDTNDYDTDAVLYLTKGGAFFAVHEWKVWDDDVGEPRTKTYFETMSREEVGRLVERAENLEVVDENALQLPPEAIDETEPGATIYVRVPAPLKNRVDAAAAGAKLSTNAWVMRCLENCLSAA